MLGAPNLNEEQLEKIKNFMLSPESAQIGQLANPGFRIHGDMHVSYARLPDNDGGFYRFTFHESHLNPMVSAAAASSEPSSHSLIFSTDELLEILAAANARPKRESFFPQFTASERRRFVLPANSDLERYQTLTSQLMISVDLGMFAPFFSSVALHPGLRILFIPIANSDNFIVRPEHTHFPVLRREDIGNIRSGVITTFTDRPQKHYLVFENEEDYTSTITALKKYFTENKDFRVANKPKTIEILGRLFDYFPDIAPAIELSKKQIIALGKAYTLNLHLGTLLKSTDSSKTYLDFSQVEPEKYQRILENLSEALGNAAFSQTDKPQVIRIHTPIKEILEPFFGFPQRKEEAKKSKKSKKK